MKEKKLKIRKVFKSRMFFFGLGAIIFGIAGVSAATLLLSSDVAYDNHSSGMSATTVQAALDELYEEVKSAPSCEENGVCTVTCPNTFYNTSTGYWCVPSSTSMGGKSISIVTSDSGLYADSTEAGRYYYSSSDPDNKIVFNGEPYRILAIEPDGRIKIIKMVSIGYYAWDTADLNVWSSSSLKNYLEETWLLTQESGEDYQHLSTSNSWYVGRVTNLSNPNILTVYTSEKTLISNSAVGLISASELLKSKQGGSTFLSYSSAWWTISPSYVNGDYAWYVWNSGSLNTKSVNSANTTVVFPVLYLKSTVTLIGSGTTNDPYCISGSSCPTNLDFTQRYS